MRYPQAPSPCSDGHHLQPRPSANTADTPPADWHRDWQATMSPRLGKAIRLLAKLAAVLVRHPNRMLPLLGKARVVDDKGLDRPVTLDLRQHHLTHLAQHIVVGPTPFTDKMQQRLMLRGRAPRRRDRRHRLYALALTWHHQSQAIVVQRTRAIRVPDHPHKPLDIARKPRFNILPFVETHPKPLRSNRIRLYM